MRMGTGQDSTSFAGAECYRMTVAESLGLRPGLTLQLTHIAPAATFRTAFTIQDSPIIFGFMLAGLNRCRYSEGTLRNTEGIHGGGSNRISYLPETVGSMECQGGMHRLSIIVSQECLEPYLAAETGSVPRALAGALAGKKDAFQWTGQRSIRKMRLVAEMFTRSYSGPLRRLYLETRALELIGLQLAEYLVPAAPAPSPTLTVSDISRIRAARELLVQDMENPPSIAQLARMAGINEKKLKCGFKQVFGLPVFAYFRNYRLEMAGELLASGIMNVTEAAMHIGYQNLSHFSEEFRKKYGVTPKRFQDGERP